MHAHHVLPKEYAGKFAEKGINVHNPKYGAWWARHEHLSVHRRGYNRLWEQKFTENPTASQLLRFGRKLAAADGLEIGF